VNSLRPVELTTKRRLSTDARREQLLASGARLLAERPFDEVSIEEIARAAGVSKGLLYHYFPTKKDFLIAALERGQEELAALTAPDPSLPPAKQLAASLDRFLDFVEEHEAAYTAIFRSRGGGDPEIQAALEAGRRQRMDAVIESLAAWEPGPASVERTPTLETAVQGWFFFIEGAVLRWLERRDLERDELRELLALALIGSLQAAATVAAPS
jgi:AcrR family transcriptional regulator